MANFFLHNFKIWSNFGDMEWLFPQTKICSISSLLKSLFEILKDIISTFLFTYNIFPESCNFSRFVDIMKNIIDLTCEKICGIAGPSSLNGFKPLVPMIDSSFPNRQFDYSYRKLFICPFSKFTFFQVFLFDSKVLMM